MQQEYLEIRTWKDMANEYDINAHGDISIQGVFLKGMKPLAGTTIDMPDHITLQQYWLNLSKVVTIAEVDNAKYYITLPMLTKKSQSIIMAILMKHKAL